MSPLTLAPVSGRYLSFTEREEIAVLLGFARRRGRFARDPAQIGDAVERLRPLLD